jgi:replicative DNA helicase
MSEITPFRRTGRTIDLSKLDRLPPHSIEAEQGLLGCCLMDPNEVIPSAKATIQTETLYDLRHQAIWDCLVKLIEAMKPVDLISVQQALKDANQLEAVGGLAYLSSLQDACPSAVNAAYYAAILKEKQLARDLLHAANQVASSIYEKEADIATILSGHLNQVELLCQVDSSDTRTSGQVMAKVVDHAQAVFQGTAQPAILTPFYTYNRFAGGLWTDELVVVSARPGVGKTAWLTQLGAHVAQEVPVGMFSAEMSAEQVVQRFVGGLAGVNVRDIKEWTQEDFKAFTVAASRFKNLKLLINDTPCISIEKMRPLAKEWVRKKGVKVIVVDYLQKLTTLKECGNREQEIAHISSTLKLISRENHITVVCACQLNRESEKKGAGRPKFSQARESGAIEQDADVGAVLYRNDEEDNELARYQSRPYEVTLDVQKGRSGGVFRVSMVFDGKKQQFTEKPFEP